jgi:hypothetical protein
MKEHPSSRLRRRRWLLSRIIPGLDPYLEQRITGVLSIQLQWGNESDKPPYFSTRRPHAAVLFQKRVPSLFLLQINLAAFRTLYGDQQAFGVLVNDYDCTVVQVRWLTLAEASQRMIMNWGQKCGLLTCSLRRKPLDKHCDFYIFIGVWKNLQPFTPDIANHQLMANSRKTIRPFSTSIYPIRSLFQISSLSSSLSVFDRPT